MRYADYVLVEKPELGTYADRSKVAMEIKQATRGYEAWLGKRITLLPADVELKHRRMAQSPFPFLRATFYRWVRRWPEVCPN